MKCDFKIKNGFTLIELMITVSILAILISIATTAYHNYLTQSKVGLILGYLPPVKNIILGYTNEHNDQLPSAGMAYPNGSAITISNNTSIDITQINSGVIKVQITSTDGDLNNKIIK